MNQSRNVAALSFTTCNSITVFLQLSFCLPIRNPSIPTISCCKFISKAVTILLICHFLRAHTFCRTLAVSKSLSINRINIFNFTVSSASVSLVANKADFWSRGSELMSQLRSLQDLGHDLPRCLHVASFAFNHSHILLHFLDFEGALYVTKLAPCEPLECSQDAPTIVLLF